MAISDISKAMALYAQPSEFDQSAWKKSFDIANAFADMSEKHRANRENLATEDWRVAYLKNNYDTGIVKNNTETQRNHILQEQEAGADEWAKVVAEYGYDPAGRLRNSEEIVNLARADGKLLNPYAINAANAQLGNYFQGMVNAVTPFNPNLGNNYAQQAGFNYGIDAQGRLINSLGAPLSGALDNAQLQQLFSGQFTPNVGNATGKLSQAELAALYQQNKLDLLRERYELEGQNIALRNKYHQQAAQEKQASQQARQINAAEQKQVDELISQAVASAYGDKAKLNATLGAIVQRYPHLKDHIGRQAAMQMQLNPY